MSSAGVEDEEILDVLRSADESRLTTTDVAEALPITRGRTRTRLQRLTDDGPVDRETVGNEVVWWLAEADEQGQDQAADEAQPDEAEGAGAEGPDGEAASVETPEVDEEAEPVAAEAETPGETGDGPGGTEEGTGGTPEEGPAEIEVEAVGDQVTSRGSVTETDEAPPERPTPGEDDEERTGDGGAIRALGLLAAAVVVLALLRRLLAGDGDR